MKTDQIRFNDGATYEQYMGKWSQLAGKAFLEWLTPEPGQRWLDVGCGNGAFTEMLIEQCDPVSVHGIDPSEEQLAYARARPDHLQCPRQCGERPRSQAGPRTVTQAMPYAAHSIRRRFAARFLAPKGMQAEIAKGTPGVARFFDRRAAWSFVLFTLPAVAVAGPWEVGGTSPSKTKKIEVEVSRKHTDSRDTWARPVLKFAAPLGDDLSYEVAAGYGVVEKSSGPTRGGAKDVTAKLMWRFLDETDRRPVLLVEPKFTFDTGDASSGVGGGVTTLKTPLRGGKRFGKVRLTGEVFYTHGFAGEYDDLVGYGGLVEYSPNERWVVGMDVLNDRPIHEGGRYHVRGDVAFKFKAADSVELQGLIGRSVENRRGELAANVNFVAAYKF